MYGAAAGKVMRKLYRILIQNGIDASMREADLYYYGSYDEPDEMRVPAVSGLPQIDSLANELLLLAARYDFVQ